MEFREQILRKTLPVIINSFNQPTYLKNCIEKFKKNNFKNIIILDNDSKSEELLDFYRSCIQNDKDLTILFYNQNHGPRHFHFNGVYRFLSGTKHLYTDPDIDFDELSEDFLCTLIDTSEKYACFKVGCALEIPKPNEIKDDAKLFDKNTNIEYSIADWESQFWNNQIEKNIYLSPIDTTLHLFNPEFFSDPEKFISGIRIAKDGFCIRHLPWYKNDCIPKEEKDFYNSLGKAFTNW